MAGIGFTLKKMFKDESYTNRTKAYFYSAFVAAGPWIAAVVTVNVIIFIMGFSKIAVEEKELFMGTIVYSFIFSQIITTPWQMVITRYISDKLYTKDYHYIRASFIGLNKVVFFQSFIISLVFYWNKPLPLSYKFMAIYLFLILNMIWILMVYLSAVKNYELIGKSYIYGGCISLGLTIYFIIRPIRFTTIIFSSNILLAYLIGISFTLTVLMYNFLSTFYFGNNLQFDFLRYLSKFSSLFLIGIFYILGLWVDDILMWFSIAGQIAFETYRYAPIYDNAVFLAYLTTIPSSVMFLVSVETEFYDTYKKYFGLANNVGTYEEIDLAGKEMRETIYRKLLFTFEVQAIITVTIALLSKQIFDFLNYSILIRNIFRVCIFGALSNIFILLTILVLLYFESRIRALIISLLFFVTNLNLTYYFMNKGLEYFGYGFTLGALIALITAAILLVKFLNNINYATFALQPLFLKKEQGVFVNLANLLNRLMAKELKSKELKNSKGLRKDSP